VEIAAIILAVFAGGLLLVLVMPLKYAINWMHEADAAHRITFDILFFWGIAGLHGTNAHEEFTFQYSLFNLRKDYVPKKKPPKAEKPSKKKKSKSKQKAPRLKKYGRRAVTHFTLNEIKQIFRVALRNLWDLLKPDRFYADIICGTGNPMWTGIIFGLLWSSSFYYETESSIRPDYIRPVIAGNIQIAGHISIGGILWRIVRIAAYVLYIIISRKGSDLIAQYSSGT